MINVSWKGDMAFLAHVPSGNDFVMDATSDSGGHDLGPTPVEALLSSIAACSAMDVVSILKKKRQDVESYDIEVEWQRDPPGSPWPRPVKVVTVRHIVRGKGLDPVAVEKAVQLSDEKYCSVMATLRFGPTMTSEFRIEETP